MDWVYVLLAALWLVVGWLPSRMHKHYAYRNWVPLLSANEAWGIRMEVLALVMALLGPPGAIGCLLAAIKLSGENRVPIGWKW